MKKMRFCLVFLTLTVEIMTQSPFKSAVPLAHAAGNNRVTFDNQSGTEVIVRLFEEPSLRRVAEVKIPNGQKRGTKVGDGQYHMVGKFAPKPGDMGAPAFSKGDAFRIQPPPGQYSLVTITLHPVVNGNYRTVPTGVHDFDK